MILICSVFLGQLHGLVDDNGDLLFVAVQHLGQCQTQHRQAHAGQTSHGPVAQMCADLVVHFGRMIVVCIQQMLAEAIHRMPFIIFFVVDDGFCQRDITKGLRKCQQKCIFAGFSTGQNIFHNVPLATRTPSA